MLHAALFWTFFRIGFVSFGGGYAMLPLIQSQVVDHYEWMTATEFTDLIGIAALSPGPVAANGAIAVGYSQAGWTGATVSVIGIVLPSLMIMVLAGVFYAKVHRHVIVKSALYSLRAVTTGLIAYAALSFATQSGFTSSWSWHTAALLLIFIGSLAALMFFRIHPVYVILLSGLIGIAVFG